MKRTALAVVLLVAFSAPAFAQGEFCISINSGGVKYRFGYDTVTGSGVYQIHGERYNTYTGVNRSIPFSGSAWLLANGTVNISIIHAYPWTSGGFWIHPASAVFFQFTNTALSGGTYWLTFYGDPASTIINVTGTMAGGQMAVVPCPAPTDPIPASAVKELNVR